jgi:hypothetical protein
VALPTGPPRLIAGLRCRPPVGLREDGDLVTLGDSGSGKREKDPDLRRLIRSLTGGSLWKRTNMCRNDAFNL